MRHRHRPLGQQALDATGRVAGWSAGHCARRRGARHSAGVRAAQRADGGVVVRELPGGRDLRGRPRRITNVRRRNADIHDARPRADGAGGAARRGRGLPRRVPHRRLARPRRPLQRVAQ